MSVTGARVFSVEFELGPSARAALQAVDGDLAWMQMLIDRQVMRLQTHMLDAGFEPETGGLQAVLLPEETETQGWWQRLRRRPARVVRGPRLLLTTVGVPLPADGDL